MRVLKTFKGTAANTVHVVTEDPRNMCGVYFTVGREYLVLGDAFDPTLYTDVCHGTAPSSVASAEADVREARHPAMSAAKVPSGSHCSCRTVGTPAESLPLLVVAGLGLALLGRRKRKRTDLAYTALGADSA
jgi:MYXO-CTERM domain-containing protein